MILFGILVVLSPEKQDKQDGIELSDPLLLSFLALLIATIVIIRFLGFYPAVLLSLPVCLVLFGERNYGKILLFTTMTTGMIYLIIDMTLGGRLP